MVFVKLSTAHTEAYQLLQTYTLLLQKVIMSCNYKISMFCLKVYGECNMNCPNECSECNESDDQITPYINLSQS